MEFVDRIRCTLVIDRSIRCSWQREHQQPTRPAKQDARFADITHTRKHVRVCASTGWQEAPGCAARKRKLEKKSLTLCAPPLSQQVCKRLDLEQRARSRAKYVTKSADFVKMYQFLINHGGCLMVMLCVCVFWCCCAASCVPPRASQHSLSPLPGAAAVFAIVTVAIVFFSIVSVPFLMLVLFFATKFQSTLPIHLPHYPHEVMGGPVRYTSFNMKRFSLSSRGYASVPFYCLSNILPLLAAYPIACTDTCSGTGRSPVIFTRTLRPLDHVSGGVAMCGSILCM